MQRLVAGIFLHHPEVAPEDITAELSALVLETMEQAGVMAAHSTETDDSAWKDQSGRMTNAPAAFRAAFAYQDPDSDPASLRSYRFFHHFINEDGSAGAASTAHCSQLIAVLNGARAGTVLEGAERRGVYNHLARHIRDAGKDAPPLTGTAGDSAEQQGALNGEVIDTRALEAELAELH
jgi:hypothetical protein